MKPKWIKLMRNEHIGRVRFAKSWPRAVIHLFYFRRFFFVSHSYNIKYERESLSEQKIQQFIPTLMLKICKYDWMNHALVESSFIYKLQLICYHVFRYGSFNTKAVLWKQHELPCKCFVWIFVVWAKPLVPFGYTYNMTRSC